MATRAHRAYPMVDRLPLAARLRWWGVVSASLIASWFLTWKLLAAVGFAYPLWYDLLAIDETIATYAPHNEMRPGFERTERSDHERLFAAMADAIQKDPEAARSTLESLTYPVPGMNPDPVLLTEPEIQHLVDVAVLVEHGERIGWISLAVLVALLVLARAGRDPPPALGRTALGLVATTGAGVAAVLLIGPVRTFYALHEMLFPPDHPWFFWYEESLMSMLMQAPNLFGPVAATWGLLATLVLAGWFYALVKGWYKEHGRTLG
ncbi:DUF1461 domain-containing protein [Thioalkalivibrio sp. ALE16]|uniref:lipoprotein intramolecular transacylase Lit n=1 Tax=Thioalkalivibrio sp. ALE16 TaxID=1158172 RepID=UPI001E31599A|nr:DUF1461 domain-containing protein [Thioalkalivibrio sp. ALE16]